MKTQRIIWLIYFLGVSAYVVQYHLFAKTTEEILAGGRFFSIAFILLIVLIVGTIGERLSERRKKRKDD